MKTSNKLILGAFMAGILIVIISNFILYREYRLGHITPIEQVQAAHQTQIHVRPARHLVLSGTLWVNIVPSDSDYIEIPKGEVGMRIGQMGVFAKSDYSMDRPAPLYRETADTLFINGSNTYPIHRPWADWFYRQSLGQITVHATSIQHILVTDGQIMLAGAPKPVPPSNIQLEAINSTVWIGYYDETPNRKPLPKEYFDSVGLRLTNTELLINHPAVIDVLQARVDSGSVLNDRAAAIRLPSVSCSPDSRVSIMGTNLIKTTFTIH